jgi:hypothetical protein
MRPTQEGRRPVQRPSQTLSSGPAAGGMCRTTRTPRPYSELKTKGRQPAMNQRLPLASFVRSCSATWSAPPACASRPFATHARAADLVAFGIGPDAGPPCAWLNQPELHRAAGVSGCPLLSAASSQETSGRRLLFVPPNKRFMRTWRSVLSSPIRTKRLSPVRSRTNALYSIFTWRSFVLSKKVSREFIVCLSSPMPRCCLILTTTERCCVRRPRRNKVRPSFRLPAKSIARFFDFAEQPGSLHFAHRRQLG